MSVHVDSLPVELRAAIRKAFEATGAMDLYEGDAVKMLAVVTQCLDKRRHQVTGAAEAARQLTIALGNAVKEVE